MGEKRKYSETDQEAEAVRKPRFAFVLSALYFQRIFRFSTLAEDQVKEL